MQWCIASSIDEKLVSVAMDEDITSVKVRTSQTLSVREASIATGLI